MKNRSILVVFLFCLVAITAQATSKEWLHVNVDQARDDGDKVRVNIPLSLMEVMLPLVEDKAISDGKIHMNDRDIKIDDLRKVWQTLKDEGNAEYVTVSSKKGNVRVFTKDNFFMVETDGDSSKGKVNIKMPMAVVDAMLVGKGNQLDLMAGIRALKESGVKDIITVQDRENTVNVWIDDNNVSSR